MKVLNGKKSKIFVGFVLAVCMLCSLKTAAMASLNDINFVHYEDESVLQSMNTNVLNTYLYGEVKRVLEPMLYQQCKDAFKYTDVVRIDSFNYDVTNGDIAISAYFRAKKSRHVLHDITASATMNIHGKLVMSQDLKQFGIQNLYIDKFDLNNFSDWLEGNMTDGLNNLFRGKIVWFGASSSSYSAVDESLFKDVINQKLATSLNQSIVKELPDSLGNAEVKLSGAADEFKLSQGYAVFRLHAQVFLNQTMVLDKMISIRVEFFMDTTDHRIVAKICPDIVLSEPEKDVTLQLILQEAWKSALKKYGQYIKF